MVAPVALGAGVVGVVIGHTATSSSPAASRDSGSGSAVLAASAATRGEAVAWIAGQVAASAIVACDPAMCAALQADGLPATRLLVAAGEYTVAMRAAGAAATAKPVLSVSLNVASGGAYTVAGLVPESGLRLEVLQDQLSTPPGKVLVRVIQASLQQHEVTVTWNGQPAVTNLGSGQ
jgi:hypothetical protein